MSNNQKVSLLQKINVAEKVVMAKPIENTTEGGISVVRNEDRKEPMRAEILKIGDGVHPVSMDIGMIIVCKAFMDYKVNIAGYDLVFIEFRDILASYIK